MPLYGAARRYPPLRRWLIGTWWMCVGLLLVSCGGSPVEPVVRNQYSLPEDVEIDTSPIGQFGGLFIEADAGEPKTFNPLLSEDAGSSSAIAMLSSGLTSWNPLRMEVEPGLAKSWEIGEDSKNFIFHLRRGVHWSDGVPFTADDVIFSFQAIYDPRYPNRTAYDLSMDGEPFKVEKIDDYTIRIETADIFAPFLEKMGGLPLLPKHRLWQSYEDGNLQYEWGVNTAIDDPQSLISLGMWILVSYRPGERMLFAPNPHYYRANEERQRLPYINHYIRTFTAGSHAAVLAFARGQTDVQGIPPDNLGWVEKYADVYDFTIYDRGPSTATNFVWFNMNPGVNAEGRPFVDPVKREWFEDVRFRQAVSYAINRESIVRGVLFGMGAPLWGPESPANKRWYNPDVQTYPFDPEQSRELLREAGFRWNNNKQLLDAHGNQVQFTLITNEENPTRRQMASIFVQNMEDIGIEVTLRFLDFNTLVGRIANSFNYEACMLGLTGGGDPSGGMSVFHSRGRLHQWHPAQEKPHREWEAEIDRLMIAQLKTLDVEERRGHWFEVQRIMSEQVPYIYLVTPNTYVGIKNRWKNLDLPSLGSPIWNLDTLWSLAP